MIMKTDTGVQPWAMMVKPFYTFITLNAMTRPAGTNYFTIGAQRSTVEHFQKTHEFYSFLFYVTGVSERDNKVKKEHKCVS